MPRYAALLRAVNVGGRKVTMKALKEAAEEYGFANASTLLASGNLVFETKKTAPEKLEAALEGVIQKTFGLVSEVMVRDPVQWAAILKANPFLKKAKDDPAHLVCVICKDKPDTVALDAYLKSFREKYDKGERVTAIGREIYIDYGDSIGQSKLILPKKVCTGTARNWNTMMKLQKMLNDRPLLALCKRRHDPCVAKEGGHGVRFAAPGRNFPSRSWSLRRPSQLPSYCS